MNVGDAESLQTHQARLTDAHHLMSQDASTASAKLASATKTRFAATIHGMKFVSISAPSVEDAALKSPGHRMDAHQQMDLDAQDVHARNVPANWTTFAATMYGTKPVSASAMMTVEGAEEMEKSPRQMGAVFLLYPVVMGAAARHVSAPRIRSVATMPGTLPALKCVSINVEDAHRQPYLMDVHPAQLRDVMDAHAKPACATRIRSVATTPGMMSVWTSARLTVEGVTEAKRVAGIAVQLDVMHSINLDVMGASVRIASALLTRSAATPFGMPHAHRNALRIVTDAMTPPEAETTGSRMDALH